MSKIAWNGFCIVAIVTALIVYACASRGMIEGGERDVTPPKITAEVPVSGTTNFAMKHIDIYFDEFIQLKDINNQRRDYRDNAKPVPCELTHILSQLTRTKLTKKHHIAPISPITLSKPLIVSQNYRLSYPVAAPVLPRLH